jgi:hypothetical protein
MPEKIGERLITGETWGVLEDRRWWKEFFEQLPKILEQVENNLTVLANETFFFEAQQFFMIEALALEASYDPDGLSIPDSVLKTKSETKYEFDWRYSGGLRDYKVQLNPGPGVPSHSVIIDRDDHNLEIAKLKALGSSWIWIPINVARPYGMEGTKLQFGEYRVRDSRFEFWPSSLNVGSFIYLWQKIPRIAI